MPERREQTRTFIWLRPLGVPVDYFLSLYVGLILILVFEPSFTFYIEPIGWWSGRLLMWSYGLTFLFVYATVVESWIGATVGKLAFQMKIVDKAGRKPSPVRIVLRNAVKAVEMTLFPIALLAYLITGKSFADRVAGTSVISSR